MTAEDLRTADFDYDLPPELIAQEPLADRAASRLLMALRSDRRLAATPDRRTAERSAHPGRRASGPRPVVLPPGESLAVGGGVLADSRFAQLVSLIPPGDLVVLNTTRVRHARLLGTRSSGAPAEVLLIHPAAEGGWIALGKPGSALQPGKRIALDAEVAVETVEVLGDG
ncbi:MAG: S-adenosylmethionine:tRNA ribosyltransferase-isomerase, partial [Gemmatimonadales bacterium]